MNRTIVSLAVVAAFLMVGCGKNPQSTGIEYAPQMYHSIPLEPYSQMGYNTIFKDGKNAQTPPEGTIARGQMDFYYPYPNNNDGYEAAKAWKSSLEVSEAHAAEGKKLFLQYCQHCHGTKGDGGGSIAAAGKFPQPPSYWSERILGLADGQLFHSITWGRNLMGAHRYQINPTERWEIIQYIHQLQREGMAAANGAVSKDNGGVDGMPPAGNPNNEKTPVKQTSN
jgi:mono/diheme cytochrome c family protein